MPSMAPADDVATTLDKRQQWSLQTPQLSLAEPSERQEEEEEKENEGNQLST